MDKFLLFCCIVIAAFLAAISGCDQGSVDPNGSTGAASGISPVVRNPLPTPTPGPTPAPAPLPTPLPADSLATQVFNLTNQFRAANGVAALGLNSALTSSAQTFALLMQQLGFFAHNSPDGTTPGQRMEQAGYTGWTAWGENIALGYTTAEDVMNGWINSPGHRANLLDPSFKELGVGTSGGSHPYWVQDFGAR